jgi:Domain of Unknown Function (DUF1080)
MPKIKYILIPFVLFCVQANAQWRNLFDGKTFNGWTKYLGVPHQSNQGIDLPKDDKGKYTQALGINNNPLGVFKIVNEDGQPAIHVSGQVFGTLTFKEEFENYHVKLEFKWGEKKWPPRQNMVRDAGLLYHGFGQQGSTERNWHPAQECQIQEGDIGDYWPTGEVTIDIPAVKTDTSDWWFYSPNAPLRTQVFSKKMSERRVITDLEKEKPRGEWNTVEVICWGDSSIHIVNGKVVMRLYNSRKIENGQKIPLKKGTIALQSEGAELYYRKIMVKPLKNKPRIFKKATLN